ncbi:uncharacterized protein LOC135805858 [Sycon ciliatum]|uniref:uncharacterized protein LOC135805858 n=1 Tax=Sycon ciliatum TaxID=27933 RepID=UPI0020AD4E32|eukprot:scpid54628/ scgid20872/ 
MAAILAGEVTKDLVVRDECMWSDDLTTWQPRFFVLRKSQVGGFEIAYFKDGTMSVLAGMILTLDVKEVKIKEFPDHPHVLTFETRRGRLFGFSFRDRELLQKVGTCLPLPIVGLKTGILDAKDRSKMLGSVFKQTFSQDRPPMLQRAAAIDRPTAPLKQFTLPDNATAPPKPSSTKAPSVEKTPSTKPSSVEKPTKPSSIEKTSSTKSSSVEKSARPASLERAPKLPPSSQDLPTPTHPSGPLDKSVNLTNSAGVPRPAIPTKKKETKPPAPIPKDYSSDGNGVPAPGDDAPPPLPASRRQSEQLEPVSEPPPLPPSNRRQSEKGESDVAPPLPLTRTQGRRRSHMDPSLPQPLSRQQSLKKRTVKPLETKTASMPVIPLSEISAVDAAFTEASPKPAARTLFHVDDITLELSESEETLTIIGENNERFQEEVLPFLDATSIKLGIFATKVKFSQLAEIFIQRNWDLTTCNIFKENAVRCSFTTRWGDKILQRIKYLDDTNAKRELMECLQILKLSLDLNSMA